MKAVLILISIANTDNQPTNVISISYGGQEAGLPAYYQHRQCNEWANQASSSLPGCANLYRFMKLGLQGISIFYASGDDGVAGPKGSNNDNGCLGDDAKIFSPGWPSK